MAWHGMVGRVGATQRAGRGRRQTRILWEKRSSRTWIWQRRRIDGVKIELKALSLELHNTTTHVPPLPSPLRMEALAWTLRPLSVNTYTKPDRDPLPYPPQFLPSRRFLFPLQFSSSAASVYSFETYTKQHKDNTSTN